MKIKLLIIAIIAFIFSGCYTSRSFTSDETYAQSHYNVDVYIDYEFDCAFCYYEMYWCSNCQTYHVHVNHWCSHHYNWYNTWYNVYYYHPHSYYYGHYDKHNYYRDVTRHYIRDNNGLRNSRGGRIDNIFRSKEYKNNIGKYNSPNIYKKQNEIKHENKTYQKKNEMRRENKTYQRPNNTQKQNVQRNSGNKNMKRR